MALRLVATLGSLSFGVPSGRAVVVGRSPECDFQIRDITVSRRHAEMELAEAGLKIRDLASTNGTFLHGERVSEAVAAAGSRIAFGKVVFTLQEDGEEAPAVPAIESSQLDATVLRQIRVPGPADLATRLAEAARAGAAPSAAGQSSADRQASRLALLLDIAKELSRQSEVGHLLDKVARLTLQVMNVDRVAILCLEAGGELVPRVGKSRIGGPAGRWRVPRSVARKAVAERVAVLIDDTPFPATASTPAPGVGSALCAPMIGGQGPVLGVIYLDNLDAGRSFGEEDLEFLTAFSGIVAVALENSQLIERARREAVVLSNFQRYFAPVLAEQIASQEGTVRPGGSKQRVTVLFSDIRGFTALSEQMTPDEIARLLTDYFTEMVEIVFNRGGTLDKFMGDALMALWGAPLERHDDADRAVLAAIEMQWGLERLNEKWRRQGRRTLSVGIGINAGEVFAGNIGSDRRLDYTVIGDAVNIAAHLCSEAGPGEILVAQPLIEAIASPPPLAALAPLPLKGKAQAVPVYRVEWRHRPVQATVAT
jgi:adenylate cyclase